MANSRVILAIVALLALALLAPSVAAKTSESNRFTKHDAIASGYDLHGNVLAWGRVQDHRVQILLRDLTSGKQREVAAMETASELILIDSLSFDGRWVAWADGRFGNLDVFAVDTETGVQKRLSYDGMDDNSVVVANGMVAWASQGRIWLHNLQNSTTWAFESGPGQAANPALAQDTLVWVQINDSQRFVTAAPILGGSPRIIAGGAGAFPDHPRADGNLVAWSSNVLVDRNDPRKGFAGAVIQVAVLPDGAVTNLTEVVIAGNPSVGDGHIAWFEMVEEKKHLRVISPAKNQTWLFESQGISVRLDGSQMVIASGPSVFGDLQVRGWSETKGTSFGVPGLGLYSVLSLVVAAAYRRRC